MDHEDSYTSLDTSTHEVAEDERGVPEVQPEQSGRTGRKTEQFWKCDKSSYNGRREHSLKQ